MRLPFIHTLALTRRLGSWARRWDTKFYVLLAALLAAAIVIDFMFTQWIGALDGTKYDQLIHYRLSSPAASPDIVIVDIDERSLAAVGLTHGRWPWPRDVIAEAIATVAEAGPKAMFVNVMFSERDAAHPDADRVLQEVSAGYPVIVYPFVRLPAASDAQSELDASSFPGARPRPDVPRTADKVAVVLPVFPELQRRIGAANLHQDEDGIVRSYEYWLPTASHWLPSAAGAMLLAAGRSPPPPPAAELPRLNWRNKHGAYERISFADLYAGMRGESRLDARRFAGKFVVIGASAPGISVTKATSASIASDDNEIIATALDDALHGTGLRQIAPVIHVLVSVALIGLLAWAFVAQINQATVDTVFAVAQASLLAITFLSVSYLTVVLDMTLPFKAAMAYFVVARIFYAAGRASERGVEEFWDTAEAVRADSAVLVASGGSAGESGRMAGLRETLEAELGHDRVLHLSEFIDGSTYLGHDIGDTEILIGFLHDGAGVSIDSLRTTIQAAGFEALEVDLRRKDADESREALWRAVVAGVFRHA